jgi:hypothetical protein
LLDINTKFEANNQNKTKMKTAKISIIVLTMFLLGNPKSEAQNWNLEFDKNGVKVWTRKLDWSKIKEFKGETIINSNLGSIIYVLDDTDNFPKWVYNCYEAKRLKKESEFRGVIYTAIKLPWPAKNRSVTYQYVATQDKATKVITLNMMSTKDIIKDDGNVRMTYMKSSYLITPLSANRVKIAFQSHADPAGDLPQSVINMFLIETPYQTLLNLKKIIESPGFKKQYLDHVEELS